MVRRYVRVPDGNFNKDGNPGRGKPVGVAVAEVDHINNSVMFGFSLCHVNDNFDRVLGNKIAGQRMLSGKYTVAFADNTDPMSIIQSSLQHRKDPDLAFPLDSISYVLNWTVNEAIRRERNRNQNTVN